MNHGIATPLNRFADLCAQPRACSCLDDGAAIEAICASCQARCAHRDVHRFLLGDDVARGLRLMGPFYGHLFRDAVPARLLRETAFAVCCWIERMNRPPLDQKGWLADDALAETLKPVLRVMAEGVPMLLDAVHAIDAWADANPSAAPPRAIGKFEAPFRDAKLSAMCRPYALWMVATARRLRGASAPPSARRSIARRRHWLGHVACVPPPPPHGKRENQPVLVGLRSDGTNPP
jgi:hypothetical protein